VCIHIYICLYIYICICMYGEGKLCDRERELYVEFGNLVT
jgi:hypothetical protein